MKVNRGAYCVFVFWTMLLVLSCETRSEGAGEAGRVSSGGLEKSLAPPSRSAREEALNQEFESVALQSLLGPMIARKSVSMFGGGNANNMWQSLLTEHIAKVVAGGSHLRLLPGPLVHGSRRSSDGGSDTINAKRGLVKCVFPHCGGSSDQNGVGRTESMRIVIDSNPLTGARGGR